MPLSDLSAHGDSWSYVRVGIMPKLASCFLISDGECRANEDSRALFTLVQGGGGRKHNLLVEEWVHGACRFAPD